jgi:hypothetical protein
MKQIATYKQFLFILIFASQVGHFSNFRIQKPPFRKKQLKI